jgi:hypothetical protein
MLHRFILRPDLIAFGIETDIAETVYCCHVRDMRSRSVGIAWIMAHHKASQACEEVNLSSGSYLNNQCKSWVQAENCLPFCARKHASADPAGPVPTIRKSIDATEPGFDGDAVP